MNNVKLPVGISDFHKLRQNEYYYVDKTNLIKELLESRIAEVTLITRPRRFGKTIGMSMLAYFFDIRKVCRDDRRRDELGSVRRRNETILSKHLRNSEGSHSKLQYWSISF